MEYIGESGFCQDKENVFLVIGKIVEFMGIDLGYWQIWW